MNSKISFYIVLGVVVLASAWLVLRMIGPSNEEAKSSHKSEQRSTRVGIREKGTETQSHSSADKPGLFKGLWDRSGSGKDRFGRDLKEMAKVSQESTQLREMFLNGNLVEVKARLDQLMKDSPNVPEYVALLGDYYLALDKYEEAESTVRKLVDMDPNNSFAREILARTLAVRGNMKEAWSELYESLKINPQSESAIEKLVVFGQMRGDTDEGLGELKTFANNHPDNAHARVVLAEKLLDRGETDGAVRAAEEGARIDPSVAGNYRILSAHYSIEGNLKSYLDSAKKWAENETDPQYREAADINLIRAYQANGMVDEAREAAFRTEASSEDGRRFIEQVLSSKPRGSSPSRR